MNHSFNVEIATKYGIEAAVLIENIAFWVQRNAANNKHFHDGYYWTYNSAAAYGKLFPYMNPKTISRILLNLEKEGMLKSGDYNTNRYNRTKWYTITEKTLDYLTGINGESPFLILRNGLLDMRNGEGQNEESSLSDINPTVISTSINQDEEENDTNEPIDINTNTEPVTDNLSSANSVKDKIQLEHLQQRYPDKRNELQELYEIILEVLASHKHSLRIAKEDMPATTVKRAFASLDFSHIEFVLESLRKNTSYVKNTKAYIQTALFNASKTIHNHYSFAAQNLMHNTCGFDPR